MGEIKEDDNLLFLVGEREKMRFETGGVDIWDNICVWGMIKSSFDRGSRSGMLG